MLRKISLTFFLTFLFISIKLGVAYAAPYLSTNYYCLVDKDTGQVIYEKGQDEKRAVASTTKMMTAILVDEYAELNEIATVSSHAAKTPEFSIGLKAGQEVEVGELLKVALIRSSNDAAVVLAEHIAGEERFFGHLMTKKAFAIGACNTHFVNASGLPNNSHYSSAYDLAVIGNYLLNKEVLRNIVAMPEATFAHPAYKSPLKIGNTNGLLNNYKGANGIKTGTTNLAGKCLVASASRESRNLIAVALKSHDRTGDCRRLLDYGFNNTKYVKVIDKEIPFKELKIYYGSKPYLNIFPSEDLYLWQGENNLIIEKKVRLNYIVDLPVKKGDILGYLDIYVNDKFFQSIPLISLENINKKSNPINSLRDILFK